MNAKTRVKWKLSSDLDSSVSKTHIKQFHSTSYDFWLWSYDNIVYRLAAILDFSNMAALVSAGFGALKKMNIVCPKLHMW